MQGCHTSFSVFVYLFIGVYIAVYSFACICVFLSICLSISLSICLAVCLVCYLQYMKLSFVLIYRSVSLHNVFDLMQEGKSLCSFIQRAGINS